MNFINRIFYSPLSETVPAPVAESQRISIIDTVRGFALLGILLMNIPYFADAYQRGENPLILKETGINYYTWWAIEGGFEGTMRALFSMLFGAGYILLITRLHIKDLGKFTPGDIYYRRLLILLAFGVINAFVFLWPGDILYNYAICGMFLFPFRNWKPKYLLIAAIVLMLFTTFKETKIWYDRKQLRVKGETALQLQNNKATLDETQQENLKKWQGYQERVKPENIKKEIEKERTAMHGNWLSIYNHLRPFNVKFESSKLYLLFFWDVIALFFLGMALLKWGVLTGKRSNRFYLLMLLIGYGLGFALNIWTLKTKLSLNFDGTRYFDNLYVSLYQERRLLQGLGHLSVIMLLYKSNVFTFLWRWLAKVGQMAFSNYLMQSIICAIIFYGFGFGFFGKLERYQWYLVVAAIWLFQIIFSNAWLSYFRFGPFEWVWRSMTYWKKQPMKRKQQAEEKVIIPQPVPELVES